MSNLASAILVSAIGGSGSGGSSGVSDVRVAGTSVVADGVASIPTATSSTAGVSKAMDSFGTEIVSGCMAVYTANNSDITRRINPRRPIGPGNFDYAVRMSLCDGQAPMWTEAEQAAAQKRLGILSVSGVSF